MFIFIKRKNNEKEYEEKNKTDKYHYTIIPTYPRKVKLKLLIVLSLYIELKPYVFFKLQICKTN